MNVVKLQTGEIEFFVQNVVNAQEGDLAKVNVPFLSSSWNCIVMGKLGEVFGIERYQRPAGFLMALFTKDMITGEDVAIQYFWMVDPAQRPGRTGIKLLEAFEQEAAVRGCKQILGGCNQVYKPKAMRRFFLKRGYAPFSEAFIKTVS